MTGQDRKVSVLGVPTSAGSHNPGQEKAPAAWRAAGLIDELTVRGRRPVLVLLVEIDQIFFHCPKAFMRSQLWQPRSWRPDDLPSHATLVKRVQETPETLEELEEHYAPANYSRLLY